MNTPVYYDYTCNYSIANLSVFIVHAVSSHVDSMSLAEPGVEESSKVGNSEFRGGFL